MQSYGILVLCVLIQLAWASDLKFPPNFKFGAATSAYQIEGGWNEGGKGENIWDRLIHTRPEEIYNNATADMTANSYHLWREDVKIVKELGLQFYRFSISWTRILPTGFTNKLNHAGVQYYSNLIDALIAEGIEPVVTMYHWDLPVKIQDLGGWTNPLIVEWFGDYARTLYSLYAGRVKTWLTINEPIGICDVAYNTGSFAPAIKEPIFAPFLCNRHVLLAHANAYRIFEKEFKPKYSAKISIVHYDLWIEPSTPNDVELANLAREFSTGRYSNAIFSKEGGWPPAVEKHMLEISLKAGYNKSRLPPFSKEEIDYIKGTADFYSMNHYTTNIIRPAKPGENIGVWIITGSSDLNAVLEAPPNFEVHPGPFPLLVVYPEGMRRQMAWLKQKYGDIDIMIMENGYSTNNKGLDDVERTQFFKKYLEQVLLSIKVDNVSIVGYTAWSLIDNFEWLEGYKTKYGIYEVDFEDPERTRTPRTSAYYYACVIKNRSLNISDSCFNDKYIEISKRNSANVVQNGIWLYVLLFISVIIFNY